MLVFRQSRSQIHLGARATLCHVRAEGGGVSLNKTARKHTTDQNGVLANSSAQQGYMHPLTCGGNVKNEVI